MESHSSVDSVADLKTGGHWLDPQLVQYSFPGLMIVIAIEFIPLTAVCCFDNGYVGKQPLGWKEYCAEYWLKSQQLPTRKVFVYKIQVNPIDTILKYGNYYDMDR